MKEGTPTYTNCVVTLIWSDGVPRTPPVMFTNDPKFRDRDLTTYRRKQIRSEADSLFKNYNVDSYQVFWLGGSSHYVPESMEILGFYGAMVQVPKESVIFHDAGNAFMSQGQSVIPLIWGTRAAIYPTIIHQFLSPNDNRYHGVAKQKWRSLAAEKRWGKDDSFVSKSGTPLLTLSL